MTSIHIRSVQSVLFAVFLSLVTAAEGSEKISALVPLTTTNYGTEYNIQVNIGGQTLQVVPDTGSADLWVLVDGYECKRPQGGVAGTHTVPQDTCGFGQATYSESPSFKPISNVYIGDHYGFGNDIGVAGYETVGIGNITIAQQQIGLVNFTSDLGDGMNSGNFGLGYAELGAFHPTNYKANSSLDLLRDRILYSTPILSMVKLGMKPYFSVVLDRIPMNQLSGPGGYIGFGTMPPVPHEEFAVVPVEVTEGIPKTFTNGTKRISEWSITVQGVQWDDQSSDSFQAVVDTANWVNVFPKSLSDKINADFDPPAEYAGYYYTVECNAKPPANFGMKIGGTMFSVNPVDMIWRDASETCYSSIATLAPESGISLMFVGDVFMKNVVTVFDFGNDQMKFAQRTDGKNSSSNPYTVPASNNGASAAAVHVGTLLLLAVASLLYIC